jgi:hypothetical protein
VLRTGDSSIEQVDAWGFTLPEAVAHATIQIVKLCEPYDWMKNQGTQK